MEAHEPPLDPAERWAARRARVAQAAPRLRPEGRDRILWYDGGRG